MSEKRTHQEADRLTIWLKGENRKAIENLARLQHRSLSKMTELLIESGLAVYREEYRKTGGKRLPSIPSKRSMRQAWKDECAEEFGE